jgi:flagellar hook-length control protein FliK
MNISSPTTAPGSGATTSPVTTPVTAAAPDGSTTGRIVPDAGNGTDVPAGTTPTQGFGSMLSKHLDSGAVADRASQGDRDVDRANDAAPAESFDPATAVSAANGVGVTASQELFPTLATSSTSSTAATAASATNPLQGSRDGASRKGRADDDRARDGDAGSDLAAQLALASQWTGAKPVDPAAATVTAADTATDTAVSGATQARVDLKALFGKGRATAGKDDAATTRATAANAADAANTAAAAASSASSASAGTDAQQGDGRGTPADTQRLTASRESDAKTRDDLTLASLDAVASAGAGTTHAGTIAAGDAFALRLAAHVSNVANVANVANVTGTVAGATTSSSSSSSTAPATFAYVQEPVGSSGWSHEVGQATLRMAATDLQSASIRLNPEHLGPMDVQVRVDNGVAHLAFSATHADTRQALEASRGTLDQLFTSQGLKMGDVSVGSGSNSGSGNAFAARGDQGGDASRRDGGGRWGGGAADSEGTVTTVTTRVTRASSLVDTFA